MPIDVIKERLGSEDGLWLKLILQIAAVLKSHKISNMVFMSYSELVIAYKELAKAGLSLAVLYSDTDKHLVFIYRKKELNVYLECAEVRAFLSSYGYRGECFNMYLSKLKSRMQEFYIDKSEFPHEIGVFLGYPMCDIKGFLNHRGLDYLYSGYWKIYDNLDETLKKFQAFDEAKKQAVEELFSGRTIYEIAS